LGASRKPTWGQRETFGRWRLVDLNDGIQVIEAASARVLATARGRLRNRLDYSPEGAPRIAPEEKAL